MRSPLVLVRLFGVALVLVLAAGCSIGQRDNLHQLPYFGPRDPYPSPFATRKVILDTATFDTAGELDPETGEAFSRTGVEVVVMVDNTRVDEDCDRSADRERSLACYFAARQDRRAELKQQFYPMTLNRAMTASQLETWMRRYPSILGVANQRGYQTVAFNDPLYPGHQRPYLDTVTFDQSTAELAPANLLPVKVAVIDSGVGTHAELTNVIWREDLRSYASKTNPECTGLNYTNEAPLNPHGTFVAGIISARQNNALGMVGIAPNAQILGYAIGDCKGRMSTAEIANALTLALQQGAEVVNLSLAGPSDDSAMRAAVVNLMNAGRVVVAAAGNDNKDLRSFPMFPATYAVTYPGFITVAWAKANGNLEVVGPGSGSNYSIDHVKIAAPGSMILSTMSPATYPGYSPVAGGFGKGSGSSFATPIVAGAAALTIGYLKKFGMTYDERMVDYILVNRGSRNNPSLDPYVKGGKLLDINKLGQALRYIRDTGTTPQPMAISLPNVAYSETLKQAVTTFTASWNLDLTHFGARLGVFDGTCGYSAPCRIQDFALSGNAGSKAITLTRNELLPLLAVIGDPDFRLTVNVAIYYVVIDPETGKPKNNFGTDAVARLDIRSLDMSNASSPFLGGVDNFRHDQRYLYIQGWSCLQGSNKAVPVELLDAANNPVPFDYGPTYDLMVPHGSPVDSLTHHGGPFTVDTLGMGFRNLTASKAGLEANPLMMIDCRTLTVAHGFHMAVSLDTIRARNLTGKKLSVRVSNPNAPATKKVLADGFGATQFTVPNINNQTSLTSNIQVTRNSDQITVDGGICSASPSPVQVEISFSNWGLRCRLKQYAGFPNNLEFCLLGYSGNYPPETHVPSLTDRNIYRSFWWRTHPAPGSMLEADVNLQLTAVQRQRHIAKFPAFWPNSSISPWSAAFASQLPQFTAAVKARDVREALTGRKLGNIMWHWTLLQSEGAGVLPIHEAYLDDRAGVSVLPFSNTVAQYWDYYNVGEPYTPSVVAYKLDPTKPIGDYLKSNLRVEKVMREALPYETPLGGGSHLLSVGAVNGVKGSGGCAFQFSFHEQYGPMASLVPSLAGYIYAFLLESEADLRNIDVDNILSAIREVPLDIRFFQDGVMIQHLLTNYGTGVTKVPTYGRGS